MQELEFANRQRLVDLSIPFPLLWGKKAAYLDSWMAGETRVMDSAAKAGVSSATVRKWRRADPEFRQAEVAVRTGSPYISPEAVEPEPRIPRDFLDRWEHSARIIADLYPLERGTKFEREHKRGTYREHQAALADLSNRIKAMGQQPPGAVPPALSEPSIRFSRSSFGAPDWSWQR